MRHIIQYRFLQMIRERSIMFWALVFPFVLGTFFYVSFGSGNMGEDMEPIKVAVVEEKQESANGKAFTEFLENMDGDIIAIQDMDKKEAMKKLKADKVDGIFYVKEDPSLTVAASDINQSILKALLDNYNQNAQMLMNIMEQHPEKLDQALGAMENYKSATEEVNLGGSTTDPNVSYFFALIAYACMSGAFLGMRSCFDGQANLSALGARRSVTPTHKLELVLIDLGVVVFIQLVNVSLLTLYIRFVLGIHLGDNPAAILIANLCGSVIGVAIGVMIGSIGKASEGVKSGITVGATLFPAFLSGLMMGNMKDVIEHNIPIINRINPAAVLSDVYYCMGVYGDMDRFWRNIIILGVMSAGLITIAFLAVRRERYDSI